MKKKTEQAAEAAITEQQASEMEGGFFDVLKVIQSKEFDKLISSELRKLKAQREKARKKAQQDGGSLKASPLDKVSGTGEELATEFRRILMKDSRHPRAVRDVIQYIGEKALTRWLENRDKRLQAKAKKEAK